MTIFRQVYTKSSAGMQAVVDKFEEIEKQKKWDATFRNLQYVYDEKIKEMDLANSVATKEHNQLRNRYCNVIPFDHNRVKLSSSKNDYINASHMPYELTGKHYIFTQGPLESTSSDFWQMVYEQESNIIVMLTDVIESGHCKCYPYFPSNSDEKTKRFGIYTVELLEETVKEYTVRKLKLTPKKAEPRIVYHFQFKNWPDFHVPEDTINFEKFVEEIRDLDDSFEDHKPIITHCSAGIGRSGTFVVADIILTALRNGKGDELPMIDDLVLHMRKYRMYCVQTTLQFRFCWQACVNWIKRYDSIKNGKESNGEALTSTGKVVDEDAVLLENRKRTVEAMKCRQRQFEEQRKRNDLWYKKTYFIVGLSAGLVVLASLFYRYYDNGGD